MFTVQLSLHHQPLLWKSPEGSSLTRVQLQAKAKVAIASDSDGSADFWGVAGWEMALSVGFGKDKAMVTDCSRAPR